ncbi:type VI secretion system contractile sheath small subunit [Psychrosphaera sp. B3R10]|uniref:Type VI secretion system contractile sheath small subunit n=1 Tax=Psychrosphaera algicola TaxID=3023714 RepID=A0ABT5FG99_9GAMM|nr:MULTISPECIES: type VI secretion system contractile sheath small subunit [unclassified Psychrosphaera]MBU2880489.1 type VI secretion system contractile sheath small subunit [Psychrosphaera sp. I2R16]MBU2987918.1 type VI secretion system contractile sheath small subunit [Psychrosphaera sp. B3R10]MDC2890164.1 type VI secretion system contractile sheath small subunit [Psychrosphaera sp. G1-22]MDO6721393.1 type VI secretion system contractile sheath small subunit [Psychrosphaera sp. 1_MG-2023]
MSKKKSGSVAPKERVNISYKPAVGDANAQIELPMKILVMGQFSSQADDKVMEEREIVNINKNNFDEVMGSMDLDINFTVPNKLSDNDEELSINLSPKSLKDFTPDKLVESVPELKQIIELRNALKALKGPLGNVPKMRRTIQNMLADESQRSQLVKEVGVKK